MTHTYTTTMKGDQEGRRGKKREEATQLKADIPTQIDAATSRHDSSRPRPTSDAILDLSMTVILLTGMPITFLAVTAITMTMTESNTLVTLSIVTGMITNSFYVDNFIYVLK